MRARPLILATAALATCGITAAPASASGPIYFTAQPIVAPAATQAAAVLPTEKQQLAADRVALKQARERLSGNSEALARAQEAAIAAPLLSQRLNAQQLASQIEAERNAAASQIDQLEQQIPALEAALAPAPVTPLLSPSANGLGAQAVAIAEQYLGIPYVWGGASPAAGFDCSGLALFVYGQLGVTLPHYAAAQWSQGPQIDPAQLQPGDLVFFEPQWNGPGHVGIFVGGDEFIEAPHTGDVVKLASLSQTAAALGFVGATRPYAFPAAAGPLG